MYIAGFDFEYFVLTQLPFEFARVPKMALTQPVVYYQQPATCLTRWSSVWIEAGPEEDAFFPDWDAILLGF